MKYKPNYSKAEVTKWYNDYLDGMGKNKIAKKYTKDTRVLDKYFDYYGFKYDWYSPHIRYSKEEIKLFEKAYNLYKEGYSLREAIKESGLQRSRVALTKYIEKAEGDIRSSMESKTLDKNYDFFENIDSEIKAYLLGFYAADGALIAKKGGSYILAIGIQKRDYPILCLYNKYICNNKSAITSHESNLVKIAINSKKIGEDLINLGFPLRKTKNWNKLPILRKDLYPHFIRGFFDGDGSVSKNFRRGKNRINGSAGRASFTCYSKDILEQIKNLTQVNFTFKYNKEEVLPIKGKLCKFEGCWNMEIAHKRELNKLHSYLYSSANYYLFRKKQKFDHALLSQDEYIAALVGNY